MLSSKSLSPSHDNTKVVNLFHPDFSTPSRRAASLGWEKGLMQPRQFMRRDNLQGSVLGIPLCIDVAMCLRFLFPWLKIRCVDSGGGNETYSKWRLTGTPLQHRKLGPPACSSAESRGVEVIFAQINRPQEKAVT
jgi:hypothetical protein